MDINDYYFKCDVCGETYDNEIGGHHYECDKSICTLCLPHIKGFENINENAYLDFDEGEEYEGQCPFCNGEIENG